MKNYEGYVIAILITLLAISTQLAFIAKRMKVMIKVMEPPVMKSVEAQVYSNVVRFFDV